jgi:hypothetical protein
MYWSLHDNSNDVGSSELIEWLTQANPHFSLEYLKNVSLKVPRSFNGKSG